MVIFAGIMEYLSKERHDQIVAELKQLIDEEYPRIKDELCEARAQGNLSDNAEYRTALMGHRTGEVVDVHAPSGTFQIRIENVTVDV